MRNEARRRKKETVTTSLVKPNGKTTADKSDNTARKNKSKDIDLKVMRQSQTIQTKQDISK